LETASISGCLPVRKCHPFDVERLLLRGQLGRLAGIDADNDDLEILAGVHLHHLQCAGQAVHLLRAEHGAVVIDQREDGGVFAEVVAQPHRVAMVVYKLGVQRQRAVQMLLHADLLQHLRQLVAGVLAHLLVAVAGDLRACGRAEQRAADRGHHRRPCHRAPNCRLLHHRCCS